MRVRSTSSSTMPPAEKSTWTPLPASTVIFDTSRDTMSAAHAERKVGRNIRATIPAGGAGLPAATVTRKPSGSIAAAASVARNTHFSHIS